MLRKHWEDWSNKEESIDDTWLLSALVTWDWDTGSNRAHYITNKIYCLAETVWSLPGEKSWVFITACVDSECFLITLLLLWRVKCKRLPPLPGLITPSSRVSSEIHDTNYQLQYTVPPAASPSSNIVQLGDYSVVSGWCLPYPSRDRSKSNLVSSYSNNLKQQKTRVTLKFRIVVEKVFDPTEFPQISNNKHWKSSKQWVFYSKPIPILKPS